MTSTDILTGLPFYTLVIIYTTLMVLSLIYSDLRHKISLQCMVGIIAIFISAAFFYALLANQDNSWWVFFGALSFALMSILECIDAIDAYNGYRKSKKG